MFVCSHVSGSMMLVFDMYHISTCLGILLILFILHCMLCYQLHGVQVASENDPLKGKR